MRSLALLAIFTWSVPASWAGFSASVWTQAHSGTIRSEPLTIRRAVETWTFSAGTNPLPVIPAQNWDYIGFFDCSGEIYGRESIAYWVGPVGGSSSSVAVVTNRFWYGVPNLSSNQPGDPCYPQVVTCSFVTVVAGVTVQVGVEHVSSCTNEAIALDAPGVRAFETWRSAHDRGQAAGAGVLPYPLLFRDAQQGLCDWKDAISNLIPSYCDVEVWSTNTSYNPYFEAAATRGEPTNHFPMLSVTTVLARAGAPANYLAWTPRRDLAGLDSAHALLPHMTTTWVIATTNPGAVSLQTWDACGNEVTITGTNGQVVVLPCDNSQIATNFTSADYGYRYVPAIASQLQFTARYDAIMTSRWGQVASYSWRTQENYAAASEVFGHVEDLFAAAPMGRASNGLESIGLGKVSYYSVNSPCAFSNYVHGLVAAQAVVTGPVEFASIWAGANKAADFYVRGDPSAGATGQECWTNEPPLPALVRGIGQSIVVIDAFDGYGQQLYEAVTTNLIENEGGTITNVVTNCATRCVSLPATPPDWGLRSFYQVGYGTGVGNWGTVTGHYPTTAAAVPFREAGDSYSGVSGFQLRHAALLLRWSFDY